MEPVEWARRWTAGPASVLGLAAPSLAPGAEARLALLRPGRWTVRAEDLASRSRNCPFLGMEMPVRVEALLA